MEERLDKAFNKIEQVFSDWLTEFEQRPIKAGLKVLILLYIFRWARRNLL